MTRRPIPPQDALWLRIERPTNLLVITSVMWTAEPVDPDRLRAVIAERLIDRYPVFSRRVVGDPASAAPLYWEDVGDLDLDRHLHVGRVPAPGDRAALQEFVGAQRGVALDPGRPLWTVHLLQGYGAGSAVVTRFHHAMADGIRLTQVMLGILDPLADGDRAPVAIVGAGAPVPEGEPLSARLAGVARRLGAGPLVDAGSAVTSLLPPALRPEHLLDRAGEAGDVVRNTAVAVATIGLWSNPRTALAGEPGPDKTAVWGDPVPLALLRHIAHATGTHVGDVCLALVVGAVARRLAAAGDTVGDLAWMVPVNLDPFDAALPAALGNHFALVFTVLPHGPSGFRERLAEVHRRVARIRDSYEPTITSGLARGIAILPPAVGRPVSDLLSGKTIGVLTDVPGPRGPMTLAGARVEGVVGWAPCSARQTVTACVFSYAGQVTVGFGTDRAVVPDAGGLLAAFDAELAAATAAVTAPPGRPGPARPATSRTPTTTRS